MENLLLLCLFPLAWPFIAKRIWHTTINYQEMAIQIVLVFAVTLGVWYAGVWSQTSDTEVWNGQVTKKSRTHGHYQTSYCCGYDKDGNCTNTCYTDHYTVKWEALTTVGNVTLQYYDRTSRSVYNSPDPIQYKNCVIGEPASIEHEYTNYIKAVPESLFSDADNTTEQFVGKVPSYPRVHSYYKFNRVINIDSTISPQKIADLDNKLDQILRTLGPSKQVNIIVLLTEIKDPTYRYALESKWLGGKKNDVVVFLGLDGENIVWTDIMTWALNSGNELFHVTLRDELQKIKKFETAPIASTITNIVKDKYDRPRMSDYEYLAEEVEPAGWVIILAIIISIGGSIALTFVFHKVEVDFLNKHRYRRYR